MPLQTAIILLLLFYGFVVMEFFVPSGGLLGIAAAGFAIGSVVVGFTHSVNAGLLITVVILATTPILFSIMVRVWPKTRVGQMMLNRMPGQLHPGAIERTTSSGIRYSDLVGRKAVAETDLIPAGRIALRCASPEPADENEGASVQEKLDAISIGGPIDAGTVVTISDIRSGKIRVRRFLPESDFQDATEQSESSPLDMSFDVDSID